MQPRFYLDCSFTFSLSDSTKEALATGKGQKEFHDIHQMSRESRNTLPYRAARTLRVLHSLFRDTPGRYALALPGEKSHFSVLRVFAETEAELNHIADILEGKTELGVRLDRNRAVPSDFAGEWRSYCRYRIPTRKTERKPDGTVRQRRILAADDPENPMPYFQLHSRTNGHHFGLRVNILTGQTASQTAEPDSYGLAVSTRPFALPHLPSRHE